MIVGVGDEQVTVGIHRQPGWVLQSRTRRAPPITGERAGEVVGATTRHRRYGPRYSIYTSNNMFGSIYEKQIIVSVYGDKFR
jgi:hypothetical protein